VTYKQVAVIDEALLKTNVLLLNGVSGLSVIHPPGRGSLQPPAPHTNVSLAGETVSLFLSFQHTSLGGSGGGNPLVDALKLYHANTHSDCDPEALVTPLKPFATTPPALPAQTDFAPLTGRLATYPLAPPSYPCRILTPLQTTPAYFLLSTTHITTFPYSINGLSTPNHTIPLVNIRRLARRYEGVKDTGVEFFYTNNASTGGGWSSDGTYRDVTNGPATPSRSDDADDNKYFGNTTHSLLLCFDSFELRETVVSTILALANGRNKIVDDTSLTRLLLLYGAFQRNSISTFAYLTLINSASGRTVKDLSRYPVFPWTLSDYTSKKIDLADPKHYRDLAKPVGALNLARLEYFKERMEMMRGDVDESFLYGTHYSTSAYVLFYLVRTMPSEMMNLQSGVYDHPDRTFGDMKDTWESVNTNHADLKELIPEFFDLSTGGKFLANLRNIPLGTTQSNKRINDVVLPPWAKSERAFIKKNRESLESPIVSASIGSWIDLVFGFNSRGSSAADHDNVFATSSYYCESDLQNMDPAARSRAMLEVSEFGVCPDMIFVAPHGGKGVQSEFPAEAVVASEIGRRRTRNSSWEGAVGELSAGEKMSFVVASAEEATQQPGAVKVDDEINDAAAAAVEAKLRAVEPPPESLQETFNSKAKSWFSNLSDRISSTSIGGGVPVPPAPVLTPAPPSVPTPERLFFSSEKLPLSFDKVATSQPHNDAIAGVVFFSPSTLVTVSRDCTIKSSNFSGAALKVTQNTAVTMPLCCAEKRSAASVAVSGYDEAVHTFAVHSDGRLSTARSFLAAHDDTVSSLAATDAGVLASVSWDGVCKLWGGSSESPIGEFYDATSPLVCVAVKDSGRSDEIIVVAGCEDGKVLVWLYNVVSLATAVVSTSCFQGVEGGVSSVSFLGGGKQNSFVLGTTLGGVVVGAVEDGMFRCVMVAKGNVGSGVRCILTDGLHVVLGCGDGCVRVARINGSQVGEVEGGSIKVGEGGGGGIFDICEVDGAGDGGGFGFAVASGDGSLHVYSVK
jgi:factor associated with neutral sphingomyelinase activation